MTDGHKFEAVAQRLGADLGLIANGAADVFTIWGSFAAKVHSMSDSLKSNIDPMPSADEVARAARNFESAVKKHNERLAD